MDVCKPSSNEILCFSYADIRSFKKKPYLVGGNQEPNCTHCQIDDGLAGEVTHVMTHVLVFCYTLSCMIFVPIVTFVSWLLTAAYVAATALVVLMVLPLMSAHVPSKVPCVHKVCNCRLLPAPDMPKRRAKGLFGAPHLAG